LVLGAAQRQQSVSRQKVSALETEYVCSCLESVLNFLLCVLRR
jgi:hypothetical protein